VRRARAFESERRERARTSPSVRPAADDDRTRRGNATPREPRRGRPRPRSVTAHWSGRGPMGGAPAAARRARPGPSTRCVSHAVEPLGVQLPAASAPSVPKSNRPTDRPAKTRRVIISPCKISRSTRCAVRVFRFSFFAWKKSVMTRARDVFPRIVGVANKRT